MKQINLAVLALLIAGAAFCAGVLTAAGVPAATAVSRAPAAVSQWTPPSPAYRVSIAPDGIYTRAEGLYQLTYAATQAAGVPVNTVDPRTFRLFWMGQEVPIQVVGEGDAVFNPADTILFYARGVDDLFYSGLLPANKYVGNNVFFLTYGGVNGLRMATKDGSIAGATPDPFLQRVHMERNRWYETALPFEHNADHWFYDWIEVFGAGGSAFKNFSLTAQNIATGTLTGSLTVRLQGKLDGPHHLRLYVNPATHPSPVLDGSLTWSGFDAYSVTVPITQSYFINGTNNIRVEIVNDSPKSYDYVYVNSLDVAYYDTYAAESNVLIFPQDAAGTWRYQVTRFTSSTLEAYDVTDMLAVQRFISTTIAGTSPNISVSFGDQAMGRRRYLALASTARRTPVRIEAVVPLTSTYTPTDLLSRTNGADYIIISHANFWSQAQALAAHRSADFRVALVDAQAIYDQFNGGLMSAEAIHDFLAYAYDNWQAPRPAYVVLLGDGTSDMRNYTGSTTKATYIPPFLYLADPDLGETAADNRFVTLVNNDVMPDMHIGRLPVNSPAEAQAVVDKIVAYETTCACNGWSQDLLFVADDPEGGGGNFADYSNAVADGFANPLTNTIPLVPPTYTVTKAYLGQTCDVVGNPSPAYGCRSMITETLNVTGALLVSYVGHATKTYWAAELLMDASALATLDNAPCLPIFLPMTCFEGSFHDPTETPLGEAAVVMPVNGAIASWSPTGFGLVTGHDLLEKGLFLALFHEGVDRLGVATDRGKSYVLSKSEAGQYDDLLDTFGLLGDPGLKVKTANVCYAPTAVDVAGFSADALGDGVLVEWTMGSELDLLGFNLLRRPRPRPGSPPAGDFEIVNDALIAAHGAGAGDGRRYAYFDAHVTPGETYQYSLEFVNTSGEVERYGLKEVMVPRWQIYLPAIR